MSKLVRGIGLAQAVAINSIDMVGIGPFLTVATVIGAMHGPQCIIAWVLGAILAFSDGAVWAELGAKWPAAGGSYVFLQNLYGKKWGKLMSFLYIWQTTIQAPLVVASGAIGFSQYLTYLVPSLSPVAQKAVSGALVILITALLYRKITDIGKISVFMGMIVAGTILWMIGSGVSHFSTALAFTYPKNAFDLTPAFFLGLGMASTQTIYSYLGYYNVCHIGGEIQQPERNIPRSIFISIAFIAMLYLLMQISVLGVIPWQVAQDPQHSKHLVSMYFETIYGSTTAQVATVLILFIALSSLFSAMLGYSRIPYAAATDGNFFAVFARLHPTKNFPHFSLLILGAIAFCFSLLFKLKDVISAIIVMRIIVQFTGQAIGLLLYHQQNKQEPFPYRMWLYPVLPIVAICIWAFVFFTADIKYIAGALGVITMGIVLFIIRSYYKEEWPFIVTPADPISSDN